MVNRKKYWKKLNRKTTIFRNKFKSNQKCSKCGSTGKLIFHHTNPNSKSRVIAHISSKKAIRKEIGRTILLCPKCHGQEHSNI